MTKKSNETFRVAVYGTLLAGERNERWAAGALSRVPCVIWGVLYDTGAGFPAFVPASPTEGHAVQAELLTVDADGLAMMDELEGYPRLYRRDDIVATLADGKAVQAMVYVMNRLPSRVTVIASGDWRNR